MEPSSGEVIMGALLSLSPHHFSTLSTTLAADLRHQHRLLLHLLLSPHHFSHTLSFLHSLSLPHKTLLLARLLLRSLRLLLLHPNHHHHPTTTTLRPHELDAALLLLAMCEVYDRHHPPSPSFNWHSKISNQILQSMLSPAELGAHRWSLVSRYVDAAAKCRGLLEAVSGTTGSAGKAEREVGASVAAVVALASVEWESEGKECVICKEEICVGRDVCQMPCTHIFHWICILPWLRRRNTCPCCRHELPTDDVFYEIERLWRMAVNMSARTSATGGHLG